MADPTLKGVVHVIEETKTYGQNGFRKRLVVLEQKNGRFSNYVPVEFIKDACDTVDQLNVNDEVVVTYRLSGRKWQRDQNSEVKYFLSAEGLSFKVANSGSPEGDSRPVENYDESEAWVESDEGDTPF